MKKYNVAVIIDGVFVPQNKWSWEIRNRVCEIVENSLNPKIKVIEKNYIIICTRVD